MSGSEDFQNKVAQIMSKSLLKEITDSVPEYKWTYLESQIVKNAVSLSFMIKNMAYEKPEEINLVKQAVLRLASLWENLARLKENTDPKLALINAAVAYEIAGYQANAYCLAKKVSKDINDENSIESLTCLFLQRQFLKLKQRCEQITSFQKNISFQNKDEAIQALAITATAHGFLKSSEYFLNGDTGLLPISETSFQGSMELLTDLKQIEEVSLIQNIRQLLPITRIRSTWNEFKSFNEENSMWNRYLKLLARGTGSDILESPSISEIWPSQKDAISGGLFDSEKNKIIKMPTSAGKTRIAEFSIVDTLTKFPKSKCVYVAPYRALVSELEDVFLNLFGDLGFRVSSIVGNYEFDPFEDEYVNNADILVTTPEKLDFLLRSNSEFLGSVRLFILDEGHMINNKTRGIKLEILLNRLKKKLVKAKFMFISAVLSDKTINQYLKWLNADQDDLIKSDWRPSISQHAKFEWTQKIGKITYESRPENKLISTFVPGIITQKRYRIVDNTGKFKTKNFPDVTNKSQTCAELSFKFSELGPVLVFAPQKDRVLSVAKALQTRLDYAKQTDEKIPTHFIDISCRSTIIASSILGDSHPITKLLKNGIAIHYGTLPDQLRRAIELDFRDKKFKVIIATTTLAQGVNLPIRTVIIHSCKRGDESGKVELVPINDYWNIAGRAGRAGQETEGTVIHVTITDSDKEDYDHYLRNKTELDPTYGALFQLLDELLKSNLSDISLRERIDPEVLALLAEENYEQIEEFIDEMLDSSLVTYQAASPGDVILLKDAFKKIARTIKNEVSDHNYLKIYSSTGFSSQSCQQLTKFVVDNQLVLKDILTDTNAEKIFQLLGILVDELSKLREMESDSPYSGDRQELLQNWISGFEIGDINKLHDEQDSMTIANFVEDFCGYRLPWGISAFLKIIQQVLQLEKNTLSDEIKYLSSMVKYGVPNSIACWCMIIGIPFKSLAIRMASDYDSQQPNPSFDDFVRWLSKIDHEVLLHKYGLSGPFLDDVTKAIFRASVNPLLEERKELNDILSKPTWIRGIAYENNRKITANLVKENDQVDLIRDYDNITDRNAIKIFYNGGELGYVERNLAQFLAPNIDCGLLLKGVITKKESRSRIPSLQLILKQY